MCGCFAALAAVASIAALGHAVFVEPVSWTVMRILTGLCYAGLYVVAESWLNDRATNQTRGTVAVGLCGDFPGRHGRWATAAQFGQRAGVRAVHPGLDPGLGRGGADPAQRRTDARLHRLVTAWAAAALRPIAARRHRHHGGPGWPTAC